MPLAAAMLKSSLDSYGLLQGVLNTQISDFYTNQNSADIVAGILDGKTDFIGFSVYLWNRELVEEVAEIIKKRAPHITLIAGGAEATANPFGLLNRGLFDFVVCGEGEEVIVSVMNRLLEKKPIDDIDGVVVKDSAQSGLMSNAFVANLDSVPSPFLNGIISFERYDGVLWELSRGCPFKCAFCFESRGVASVRRFSIERIKQELKLFEKSGVVQVFVLDATFNFDKKRAKEILRLIQHISPSIHFIFEVRTEFIDRELATLFASINCSLQIGLQSSDVRVLSNVNRIMDIQKFKEKIAILNRNGVVFGLDLIYGLPEDSFAGFKKSIDYAVTLQPNNLDIFPLSIFPGTALFDDAERFSMNAMKRPPYQVISTPEFSENDMKKAKKLAESCNLFYNRGRAVGWLFMILETLNLSPSAFFDRFSAWQKKQTQKMPLFEMQLQFVRELFQSKNRAKLYPPMADIMRYHQAISHSLDSGFSEKRGDRIEKTTVLKHAKGTHFLGLNFELDDLLHIGEVTLSDFVKHARMQKNEIVIFNDSGAVTAQPLDREWIDFLKAVDGRRTLSQILQFITMKQSSVVDEFVEFCMELGMLIR